MLHSEVSVAPIGGCQHTSVLVPLEEIVLVLNKSANGSMLDEGGREENESEDEFVDLLEEEDFEDVEEDEDDCL